MGGRTLRYSTRSNRGPVDDIRRYIARSGHVLPFVVLLSADPAVSYLLAALKRLVIASACRI